MVGGSREFVVYEHHSVADEDVIFDGHAFAQKTVARDLATPADLHALLYLDKRPDPRLVPDLAPVSVDEREYPHILTQFHPIQANKVVSEVFYGEFGHYMVFARRF